MNGRPSLLRLACGRLSLIDFIGGRVRAGPGRSGPGGRQPLPRLAYGRVSLIDLIGGRVGPSPGRSGQVRAGRGLPGPPRGR